MRSTSLSVTYQQPFTLSGSSEEIPAGRYELQIQHAAFAGGRATLLEWTAAYLIVPRTKRKAGRTGRRPLNAVDLAEAMRNRVPPTSSPLPAVLDARMDRT